jgi:hypothetical protein
MRIKHISGLAVNGSPTLRIRVDGRLEIVNLTRVFRNGSLTARKSLYRSHELF